MQAVAKFLSSVVLFAFLSASHVRGAEPPFSLVISVPRTTVRVGSEVRVKLVLMNISDHEIAVPDEELSDASQFGFGVEVRDSQGRLAHLAESGPASKFGPQSEGSHYMPIVRPGKSLEVEININKIYDMSKPGKYTILTHRTHTVESGLDVKSNTITITVER